MRLNMRLSTKTKVGYGVGLLGEAAPLNLFYTYFIFFLTTAAGVEAGIAGTIALVASFFNAGTDIYAGFRSDNSTNPKGKRRPYIFKWAIPLAIATALLYSNFLGLSGGIQVVYYLVISLIFMLALSMADIPYLSLCGDLSDSEAERADMRGYSNIFQYIGMILAMSGTLVIVATLADERGLADTSAWMKYGILVGVVALVAYWIAVASTKGHEKMQIAEDKGNVNQEKASLKDYIEIIKLKPWKYTFLYIVLGYGGMVIFLSGYIYFLTINAGLSETQAAMVALVYCIVQFFVSAIIMKIVHKIDKRYVIAVCCAISGLICIIIHFTGAGLIGSYVLFMGYELAVASFFIPNILSYYEVGDLDRFVSGKDRTAIVVSLFYSIGKIMGGIGMCAIGWILTASGFDGVSVPTEAVYNGISTGVLLIPGIMIAIGGLIMLKYPISKEKSIALHEAIELKEAGKEYSTEKFRDIL